jgi:hypothetical protein
MNRKSKSLVLRIVSVFFMLGGVVRLFATESTFKLFNMQHLWSGDPFFIYIYRALGVFVVWVGIILYISSKDILKYRSIIRGSILALVFFFFVSLLTGIITHLGVQYYLVDSLFALFLIILFLILQSE